MQSEKELKEFLPEKPYSSDKLMNGLRILPREVALKRKYIELNPFHMKKFITFDLDYDVDWLDAAKEFNIKPPFWEVINLENGHAHFIYVLKNPVFCTEAAHLKPLRYLDAIIKAMTRTLKADPRYTGLISKNPFNNKVWSVRHLYKQEAYELSELASCVPDEMYELSQPHAPVNEDISMLGRNCYIFEHVRVRAYRERREFWNKSYDSWLERVRYMCEEENANFSEPLGQAEINQISKSIARWTLGQITPEGFAEAQRAKVKIRWNRESFENEGIKLLREGFSVLEIMEILDVSRRTVFNWKNKIVNKSIKVKVDNWG